MAPMLGKILHHDIQPGLLHTGSIFFRRNLRHYIRNLLNRVIPNPIWTPVLQLQHLFIGLHASITIQFPMIHKGIPGHLRPETITKIKYLLKSFPF